jgi:hypothetical protein
MAIEFTIDTDDAPGALPVWLATAGPLEVGLPLELDRALELALAPLGLALLTKLALELALLRLPDCEATGKSTLFGQLRS